MKRLLTVLLATIALPVFGQGLTVIGNPVSFCLNGDPEIVVWASATNNIFETTSSELQSGLLYSPRIYLTTLTNIPDLIPDNVTMSYKLTTSTNGTDFSGSSIWGVTSDAGTLRTNSPDHYNYLDTSTQLAAGDLSHPVWYRGQVQVGPGAGPGTNVVFYYNTNCFGCQTPSTATNWVKSFGGSGYESGTGVAVDTAGNIIGIGYFAGTLNLGTSNLVSTGTVDMYLAKFTVNGSCVWSERFGGSGVVVPVDVVLDTNNNITVGGYYTGGMNVGTGNLTNAGSYDSFIGRYDSNGVPVWSARWGNGSAVSSADQLTSIGVDRSGNVFAASTFVGREDFGSGYVLDSWYGGSDLVLLKYNSSGAIQWASNFQNISSIEVINSITFDPVGNVTLVGIFDNFINFGGADLTASVSGASFYAKLNPTNGAYVWDKLQDNVVAIRCISDTSSNMYVAGTFNAQNVSFGANSISSGGMKSVFLAKYNAAGVNQWATNITSSGNSLSITGIALDESTNVYLSGSFTGTWNAGNIHILMDGSITTGYLAKFSSISGTCLEANPMVGSATTVVSDITSDSLGNIIGTGYYSTTATFLGTRLISAGSLDIFAFRWKF